MTYTADGIGLLTTGNDLDYVIVDTLTTWIPTYISSVERQASNSSSGLTGVFPRPNWDGQINWPADDGTHPWPSTAIHAGTDFQTVDVLWPVDIVSISTPTDSRRFGNGDITQDWRIQIACICAGQDETLARLYAQAYGAAVTGIMLQQFDYGWCILSQGPVMSLPDTEDETDAFVCQTTCSFTVSVDQNYSSGPVNVNALANGYPSAPEAVIPPLFPVVGDTYENPDPNLLPAGWTVAESVNINLTLESAYNDISPSVIGTTEVFNQVFSSTARAIVELNALPTTTPPLSVGVDILYEVAPLTGDVVMSNPSGTPSDGQVIQFIFKQDDEGGHQLTFGNAYEFGTDVTTDLIPTDANSEWRMMFAYSGEDAVWQALALARF